jgi:hypothetical protein
MRAWAARSSEERGLLNPSFCATILWHAATGHVQPSTAPLAFETAFLVLPMVLHRGTREALPKAVNTSLPVWLDQNPLSRPRIADRARLLVPFTKEALQFGGVHGLLRLDAGDVRPVADRKARIVISLKDCSDEVRQCAKRAEFLGRWFAITGSAATVMALIGVRP